MTKPSLVDAPLDRYAGPVKRTRLLALAGVGLTLSLMLTGCFFSPPSIVGGGTGGSGESGQSDGSESNTDPGTDEDLEQFAGKPATFPPDIPLIDGEVVFGIDVGTGWSVIISIDDVEADFADASQRLKTAGFEALAENTSADGGFGAFENDTYQVQVTTQDSPDYGLVVNYLVVRLG